MNLLNDFLAIILVAGAVGLEYYNDITFVVGRKREVYNINELPEDKFSSLSQMSDVHHLREAVRNILVPRVVGTAGHKRVRNYIVNSLSSLGWSVELDDFHENTPNMGKLHFHNIIATLNPNAKRYLVLSCHYDSKVMPGVEFLGATDSAVPCSMLLNLAKVLDTELKPFRDVDLSLMLIFFDGEEAFEKWGPTDSIYGARNLAKRWESEGLLDRIDMLVLLDLIGAPDPKFYSFYSNTESWYSVLLNIENRLSDAGMMSCYQNCGVSNGRHNRYFEESSLRNSFIEDDHIPFLQRDVPILHIIPTPFPSVWHTPDDNESVIDYDTTENIGRILRLFTMQYLMGFID